MRSVRGPRPPSPSTRLLPEAVVPVLFGAAVDVELMGALLEDERDDAEEGDAAYEERRDALAGVER